MNQTTYLLSLFRLDGGRLTTADFARDPKISCEYRRALCDLDKHGYGYVAKKLSRNLWEYRLVEPKVEKPPEPVPVPEPVKFYKGQGVLAL